MTVLPMTVLPIKYIEFRVHGLYNLYSLYRFFVHGGLLLCVYLPNPRTLPSTLNHIHIFTTPTPECFRCSRPPQHSGRATQ